MQVFRFAALAVLVAAPVRAQEARLSTTAPRVLFTAADSVKSEDGGRIRIVTTLTYDPVSGEYVHEMIAGDGRVLARRIQHASVAAPTPTEAAVGERLIATNAEIAPLIASADGRVLIQGGFPLVREAGHPCGPGGRCATYDVFEVTDTGRRRLRYVIVDFRAARVLDADADPDADSNLANPAARRQSRH